MTRTTPPYLMDAGEVAACHELWHVEAFFCMSRHDPRVSAKSVGVV